MIKRRNPIAFAVFSTVVSSAAFAQTDAPPTSGNESFTEPAMMAEGAVADAPSMRLKALADAFTILKSRGVEITDATRLVRADILQTAQEEAVFNGAAGTRIMQVKDEGTLLIAWRFENDEALTINARLRPDAVLLGKELLMPADCTDAEWHRIKAALSEESKTHDAQLTKGSEAAAALSTLQTVRGQIELFAAESGRYPDFANQGWSELTDGGYLATPPTCPLTTCVDASRIITISEAGQSGTGIPSDQAAWVWNAATHTLFVAGHEETSLRDLVREQDQLLSQLRTLQLDASKDGAEWMKERVVRGEIASMRSALAQQYAAMTAMGSANGSFPSLDDLKSAKVQGMMRGIGMNPFNGSDEIQQAAWNAAHPPVFGEAGWNYDPNTGKFWANTATAGVNEF